MTPFAQPPIRIVLAGLMRSVLGVAACDGKESIAPTPGEPPSRQSATLPGIGEFEEQWYFFYHFAGLTIDGQKGALGRRAACVEYTYYDSEGHIKSVTQTEDGVSVSPSEQGLAKCHAS